MKISQSQSGRCCRCKRTTEWQTKWSCPSEIQVWRAQVLRFSCVKTCERREAGREAENNTQTVAVLHRNKNPGGEKAKPSSQEGTFEDAATCETFEPKIKTECQMERRGSGEAITNGKTSFRYQSGFQELMNYYCCWWLFCLSRRLCWYGLLLFTGLCQMFFWNLVHHWAALYKICNYYSTLVISYITSKKSCLLQRK